MKDKNMNGRRALFVTDLDGTLLNDRRKISDTDFQSLARLKTMGCFTVVATGRSNYSLLRLLSGRGFLPSGSAALPVDYFIFSTGAGIMAADGFKILQSAALQLEAIREIVEILEEVRVDYMIHRPVPHTREFLFRYHGGDNPDFQSRLKIYRKYGEPLTTAAFARLDGATEILCILPPAKARELAPKISRRLPQYSVIPATSPLDHKSIWVEIFAPTVSKSRALMWLTSQLKINVKNVCAVGNDYNDEDMLAWAGSSYVVANSPKSLKSRFTTVTNNNESGVTEAVERWLKIGTSKVS